MPQPQPGCTHGEVLAVVQGGQRLAVGEAGGGGGDAGDDMVSQDLKQQQQPRQMECGQGRAEQGVRRGDISSAVRSSDPGAEHRL